MVAARDIQAGETVMEDLPLTYGPMTSVQVEPLCLGCYTCLTRAGPHVTCVCGWPMCSDTCGQQPLHRDLECQLFCDRNIKIDLDNPDNLIAYNCISPIRALLLRKRDPERFSMIWGLMSHNEARRKEDYWIKKHQPIVKFIRENLGLTEFSEDDIDTVLGIFLVNDFEIYSNSSVSSNDGVRGLYQIASIPNHDCIANTNHQFASLQDGFRMIVKAARDIKKGEEITHSYVEAQEPFLTRQEVLHKGKFFHCQCSRCHDPTELGTFASALKCPGCKSPVITTNVNDLRADWECNNVKCKRKFPPSKIVSVLAAIKEKAEQLEYDKDKPEKCGVEAHEAFLKKYSPILHSKHVFLIKVKYNLAKMYGRMEGYEANSLTENQLLRKQELCEEVLSVYDIIIPGNNWMRGVMLYELHLPHVLLANRLLQRGPGGGGDPVKIKAGLRTGLNCLKQGMDILKLQPEESFEAKIVAGSKDSLVELENWVKTIENAM